MSLTIVADDLTGACDTGSLFAADGPVPLAIWPAAPSRAAVRVVDTESRATTEDDAAYDEASGRWTGLSGVNVTVGLPFLRVSVDHGTAFDRAWTGIANHESMVEAIDVAVQMLTAGR